MPLTAQPFDQDWTLYDTCAYLNVQDIRPEPNTPAYAAWREDFLIPLKIRVHEALAGHIVFLAQQGKLAPIDNVEGVSLEWVNLWNAIASDPSAWKKQDPLFFAENLARPFSTHLAMSFAGNSFKDSSPESSHDALCRQISEGTWEWCDLRFSQCSLTGLDFCVEFKGWHAEVGLPPAGDAPFIPLAPGQISLPGLEHAVIPVPSGKLLLCDWFRIPELTKIMTELCDPLPSVNSVHGAVMKTKTMAEILGLGHIAVGNTSPTIVSYGSILQAGRLSDESDEQLPPTHQGHGQVYTDLWWTTIADRQVLIELLARTMPMEKAQSTLDEYIAQASSSVVEITVVPGIHHLYFAGHTKLFAERCQMEEADFSVFDRPMWALSPTPLTPKIHVSHGPRP